MSLRSGARQSSNETSQSRSVPNAGMMPSNSTLNRTHPGAKRERLMFTSYQDSLLRRKRHRHTSPEGKTKTARVKCQSNPALQVHVQFHRGGSHSVQIYRQNSMPSNEMRNIGASLLEKPKERGI